MAKRKRHTPEQIIQKLREVEVLVGQGSTVAEAVRKIEVTEQTYYRWREEYGGMRTDQAKRLNDLENENARLKQLVAEKDGSCVRLRPTHRNHVWSYDFVEDRLANGKNFRMLTVIDEYSRESLAIVTKKRLNWEDVVECL